MCEISAQSATLRVRVSERENVLYPLNGLTE